MVDFTLEPLLPTLTTTASSQASLAESGATADFESFLTLLTAQLRNQDPLSPLESTEFVAQLASFSSVEQLVGANELLQTISDQNVAGQISDLSSWIGREVTSLDGKFRATGGPIEFTLPGGISAERIEAEVLNENEAAIDTFNVLLSEDGTASWDGLNASGAIVAPQDLSIRLKFFDGGTVTQEHLAQIKRTVVGLRGTSDGPILETSDGGTLAPQSVGRVT